MHYAPFHSDNYYLKRIKEKRSSFSFFHCVSFSQKKRASSRLNYSLLLPLFILDDSGDSVPRFTSCKNSVEIIECPESHGIARLPGGAADVGHKKHVIEFTIGRINIRLIVENIEACGIELTRFKCCYQCLIINDHPSAGIDDNCTIRKQSYALSIQQAGCLRRCDTMERQEITIGH